MKKSLPIALVFAASLAACGNSAQQLKPGEDSASKTQHYDTVAKHGTGAEVDPSHGAQIRMAYGAILGVDSVNANGVGFLRTYADGVSVATINLNIEAPAAGQHYVVWSDDSKVGLTMRGELTSIVGDVRHSTSFQTTDAPTDFYKVMVTLESTAKPSAPGKEIAEGTLKLLKQQ